MIYRTPTIKSIDRDEELRKSLYSYLYHDVHCRPYSEYRHNLTIRPLFQEPKKSIVNVSSTSIRLPASGRWFLYTVENNAVMQIKFPNTKDWLCMANHYNTKTKAWEDGYCTLSGVDVRFIMRDAVRCIPRHAVWLLKNPKANNFIFAIDEMVMTDLFGETITTPPDIHLNMYYHNSSETFKVVGHTCTKLSDRNNFFNEAVATSDIPKIIFINGIECVPKNLNDVFEGSYGEIVYDSSIVGSFTVDYETFGKYVYTTRDSQYKFLCHIPKDLNPDNDLITHRNCDVYIHPPASDTRSYTSGLYIERTNTDNMFNSITHNDFAINRTLIANYAYDNGNKDEATVKVFVRNHHNSVRLTKDPNHLIDLYQMDDSDILEHLLGNAGYEQWKAKNLEVSQWTTLMDDYYLIEDKLTLKDLVNGLGYINSANAICSRVQHILISSELQREFYIPIPICYMELDNLRCHVFVDGKLIDIDSYKCERVKQFFDIRILSNIELAAGSRITIELFEDLPYYAKEVAIADGSSFTFYSDRDYLIYKVVPFSTRNQLKSKSIYNRFTNDKAYKEFTDLEYSTYVSTVVEEESDHTYVTVHNTSGSAFDLLIVSKYAYAKIYGVERHMKELNYDIWCSHKLMISAKEYDSVTFTKTTDTTAQAGTSYFIYIDNRWKYAHYFTSDTTFDKDKKYYVYKSHEFVEADVVANLPIPAYTYYEKLEEGDTIPTEDETKSIPATYVSSEVSGSSDISIPYLNTDRTILVYFNGRELTEGLDYGIYQISTTGKCSCGQFVVMQNVDYMQLASNTFEVFTVNEKLVTIDTGFMTGKNTESIKSHMTYYNNIGQVFVSGLAMKYCKDDPYFVNLNEEVDNGSPYKIRALLPRCLTDKWDTLCVEDSELTESICKYLESYFPVDVDLAVIPRSHHIYSVFLQTVTEQILRKKLKYDMSWSDEKIKTTLAPYLDMIEFDLGLSSDNVETTDPETFAKAPEKGLDFRFVDVLPSYRLERIEDSDLTIREERPIMIVSNSNVPTINGNFICSNPDLEYLRLKTAQFINVNASKKWENSTGAYITHSNNYWRMYNANHVEIYKAHDNRGVVEIWDLEWEPLFEGCTPLIINKVYVEVNTSNEFKIHRLQFAQSAEEYAYLMRVAKMYLQTDLAKDGMNI